MSSYKWDYGKCLKAAPFGGSNHEATVIMLHGLGDTGEGWSFCADHMQLPGVKWLFPTAPTRPISCNMGMAMPGWFDIKNLPLDPNALESEAPVSKEKANEHVDESDIADSAKYCLDLVRAEMAAGVPASKIVIGGFSQGGHIAARAALDFEEQLAGCVVLSSWVGEIASEDGGAGGKPLSRLPFFIGHGEVDPMVPPALGHKSHQYVKSLGNQVIFRTYAGVAHSCNMQELDDVKDFLVGVLEDDLTLADVGAASAGKLKKWLLGKGVDITGCLEKQDLIDKATEFLGSSK